MSQPNAQVGNERSVVRERRSRANLAAFLIGIPLASAILCIIYFGPLRETTARRYVTHPVECVGVIMFCMAAGALGTKLRASWTERRACRMAIVPPWDGRTISVEKAPELLARLQRFPRRIQNTYIAQRSAAMLEFLCWRGSAEELDDQLRSLADTDALSLETSYALIRFITWAIPIIGFLGTVLGITGAISGVTPEVLEKSLSTVTDGLALAFDTTALALGLTLLTMFLSFIVERAEQRVLDQVDRYVERELAHRFERASREDGELAGWMRKNSEVLLQTIENLVQKQTRLWSEALERTERRGLEFDQAQQARLTSSLESALNKTLDSHARRLSGLEQQFSAQSGELLRQLAEVAKAVRETGREQQAAAGQIGQALAAQLQALAQIEEGDQHLHRLQETLNQNLAVLAGAGAFEQAVHSLTAAVHLLTARAAPSGAIASRLGQRPGAAA